MHKGFLKAGAIVAALAVMLGAFAAHGLKEKITVPALVIFETAVKYQFYHAFALLITGILYAHFTFKITIWAGKLFIAGIIVFCGSLYCLVYFQTIAADKYNGIGAITPLGGVFFITGWIFLLLSFFRKNNAAV